MLLLLVYVRMSLFGAYKPFYVLLKCETKWICHLIRSSMWGRGECDAMKLSVNLFFSICVSVFGSCYHELNKFDHKHIKAERNETLRIIKIVSKRLKQRTHWLILALRQRIAINLNILLMICYLLAWLGLASVSTISLFTTFCWNNVRSHQHDSLAMRSYPYKIQLPQIRQHTHTISYK